MSNTIRVKPSNSHLWQEKTPLNAPLVGITWRDIVAVSNWNEEEEVTPAIFYTEGRLLYQGPYHGDDQPMVVIATTYDWVSGKWADYVAFPASVVKEIKVLIRPKKKKAE